MVTPPLTTLRQPGGRSRQYVTVRLEQLRIGTRIRAPIWEDIDDRDILLLSGGSVLTDAMVKRLAGRGVKQVRVHPSDAARLTGKPISSLTRPPRAAAVAEEQRSSGNRWNLSPSSFMHRVARHGTQAYDPSLVSRYEEEFQQSVASVDRLVERIVVGCIEEAPQLAAVSSSSLIKMAADMDLFVALGVTPNAADCLGGHSTQAAMLAMAIGTMLGLKRDDLIELGTGCLIHDAGMMRLKIPVHRLSRELTRLEFLEVTKHPSITYDLLQPLRDVPTGARMVAYQMHERCDGSGYPRHKKGPQIHGLARIAAVADVFVALISPRPWRRGLTPYKAIEKVIRDTQKGLFDPHVVRALLHTVSLFPIGSFVKTNDRRIGRVVRANRERYMTPVVELWTPERPAAAELVDLAKEPRIMITATLDHLPEPRWDDPALDHWE